MKKLILCYCFQALFLITYGQNNTSSRYYVDKTAEGGLENGFSWFNAFRDLQDAIAVAQYGDTIWVAQSIYRPTDDDDRTRSFELRNGVTILGGFNGTEWYEWQRNPELYETVLSGEIGDPADSTDNSMHVVYTLGTDENTALDGFTITRGFAYQTPGEPYIYAYNIGAGVFVDVNADFPYARPRIRQCRFVLNTARLGGGIYCYGVGGNRWADPVIMDCVFERNYAVTNGGAIYKEGESPLGGGFIIHRCRFDDNTGLSSGGAIMLQDPGMYIELRNCSFDGNKSMDVGGAIYYESYFGEGFFLADSCIFQYNQGGGGGAFAFASSQLGSGEPEGFTFYFSNSLFNQNRTPNANGGAIAIGNLGTDCQLYIIDCTFSDNWSLNGGSGIYLYNAPHADGILYVRNSRFIGNEVPYLGVFGGIFIQGHIASSFTMTSRLEVYNTVFARNDGAIAVDGWEGSAESIIQNCTFYENGKYPISKNWDPLFDYEDYYNRMEIANCVIWEPSQPLGRILYNGSLANFTLHDYTIRHCLISADDCNLPGGAVACEAGNIFDTYPVFVDTLLDDFRLAACSPAINTGSNAHLDSLGIYYDLAGVPRILESQVDIGAYERPHFQLLNSEVHPADCADEPGGSFVVATNGDEPLSYTWSNEQGQSGSGNDQLLPGIYQFTVTDFPGCSDTLAVQIDSPESLFAAYEAVNASSFESTDGIITISQIAGGTPPYEVMWSTGETGVAIDSLGVGDYQVLITDSLGCGLELDITISADVAVEQPDNSAVIKLYPNPAKVGERCLLQWDVQVMGQTLWYTLTDSKGQRLGRFEVIGGEAELPIGKLTAGVYYVLYGANDWMMGGLKMVVID